MILFKHCSLGAQHKPDHMELKNRHHKAPQAISFSSGILGVTESVASGSPADHSARSSSIRQMATVQRHAHVMVASYPVRSRAILLALFLSA